MARVCVRACVLFLTSFLSPLFLLCSCFCSSHCVCDTHAHACVCTCMHACVCVPVCVGACVRACVCVSCLCAVCVSVWSWLVLQFALQFALQDLKIALIAMLQVYTHCLYGTVWYTTSASVCVCVQARL